MSISVVVINTELYLCGYLGAPQMHNMIIPTQLDDPNGYNDSKDMTYNKRGTDSKRQVDKSSPSNLTVQNHGRQFLGKLTTRHLTEGHQNSIALNLH